MTVTLARCGVSQALFFLCLSAAAHQYRGFDVSATRSTPSSARPAAWLDRRLHERSPLLASTADLRHARSAGLLRLVLPAGSLLDFSASSGRGGPPADIWDGRRVKHLSWRSSWRGRPAGRPGSSTPSAFSRAALDGHPGFNAATNACSTPSSRPPCAAQEPVFVLGASLTFDQQHFRWAWRRCCPRPCWRWSTGSPLLVPNLCPSAGCLPARPRAGPAAGSDGCTDCGVPGTCPVG
jgi:hypothetical protein